MAATISTAPLATAALAPSVSTASGPCVLVLDFSRVAPQTLAAAVRTLLGLGTSEEEAGAPTTSGKDNDNVVVGDDDEDAMLFALMNDGGRGNVGIGGEGEEGNAERRQQQQLSQEINAALSIFGILFSIAKNSNLCPDGCVPSAVMGLLPLSLSGGGAQISDEEKVETLWLYNSMDENNVLTTSSKNNNDAVAGSPISNPNAVDVATDPPTPTTMQSLLPLCRRTKRLWTSNRHYEEEVLPVIVGTLLAYILRKEGTVVGENGGGGEKNNGDGNADSFGHKRPRRGGGHEAESSKTCDRYTHEQQQQHAAFIQGALMKALCFIQRHSDDSKATGHVDGASSSLGGPSFRPRRRTPTVLLASSLAGGLPTTAGDAHHHEASPPGIINNTTPTLPELAASMTAHHIVSSGVQLYVGVGSDVFASTDSNNTACNTMRGLFALTGASGGAFGTLYRSTATVHGGGGAAAPSSVTLPPLLDHILGFIDDEVTAALAGRGTKGDTNNNKVRAGGSTRGGTTATVTTARKVPPTPTEIAARLSQFGIHVIDRGDSHSHTFSVGKVKALRHRDDPRKADGSGVSCVRNETLCVRSSAAAAAGLL